MSDDEEMVAVDLGLDYYLGAGFSIPDNYPKDYLVPRSQLERWEAAQAAYEAMQSEIERVMDEQLERVRALRAERPQSPMAGFLQRIYERRLSETVLTQVSLRGPNYQEPK